MTAYLPMSPMRLRFGWIIWTISAFSADQLTKYWAVHHLIPYHVHDLTSHLDFVLSFNTGAAFSLLSGTGAWHQPLLITLASLVSLAITITLFRLAPDRRGLRIGLALMLGGALGNVLDRLVLGYVIDFIDLYTSGYHWPAFNLADAAVCVGGALIFFAQRR